MTKYRMLTPKEFKKKLDAGHYVSGTGARRAIGKMRTWSKEDRATARGWVIDRFGPPGRSSPHRKERLSESEREEVVCRIPGLLKSYFDLDHKSRLALLDFLKLSDDVGVRSCSTLRMVLQESEDALRRK
jgi:hypothetical protein